MDFQIRFLIFLLIAFFCSYAGQNDFGSYSLDALNDPGFQAPPSFQGNGAGMGMGMGGQNRPAIKFLCPPKPYGCIDTMIRADGCHECTMYGCIDESDGKQYAAGDR